MRRNLNAVVLLAALALVAASALRAQEPSAQQIAQERAQAEVVISEITAPGLAHATTIDAWPPGDKNPGYFLVLFRKP